MKAQFSADRGFRSLSSDEIAIVAGGEEEIVVTATREQVAAAKMAYARAENEILFAGGLLTYGIGAYFSPGVGAALYVGDTASGFSSEAIEQLANAYYLDDGADGVYDGVSDSDRNAPYPY